MAQAEFTMNNTTNQYYIGAFFDSSIDGNCPSVAADTFYHDIPNNSAPTGEPIDRSGNVISSVTNISGITIQPYPTGTAYAISFCTAGSPSLSGFTSILVPNGSGDPFTIITWSINTGTNRILISFF